MNERVILEGKWKYGVLHQSYIAATNVGDIDLTFDPDLNTSGILRSGKIINEKDLKGIRLNPGQEVGRFNLGSSVLAIVEVPKNYKFGVKVGDKVRYGDALGSYE